MPHHSTRKTESKGFCSRIGNGLKGNWISYFSFTSKSQQRKLVSSKSAPTKSGITDEFIVKPFHRNSAPAFSFKPRSSSYIRLNYRKISVNESDLRRKSQLTTIFANNETDTQSPIPISNTQQNQSTSNSISVDKCNLDRQGSIQTVKTLVHQSTIRNMEEVDLRITEAADRLRQMDIQTSSPPNREVVKSLTENVNIVTQLPCEPKVDVQLCNKQSYSRENSSMNIEDTQTSQQCVSNNDDYKKIYQDGEELTQFKSKQSNLSKSIVNISNDTNKQIEISNRTEKTTPGPGSSRPSTGFEMETSLKERQWSVDGPTTKTGSQHWNNSFRRCKYAAFKKIVL